MSSDDNKLIIGTQDAAASVSPSSTKNSNSMYESALWKQLVSPNEILTDIENAMRKITRRDQGRSIYIHNLVDTKRYNELSLDEEGSSPLGNFTGTQSEPRWGDFHTWRCVVFVLEDANWSGLTGTPKW